MTTLGWRAGRVEGWELGRIWRHADGSYLVLEQSEDVRGEHAERSEEHTSELQSRE